MRNYKLNSQSHRVAEKQTFMPYAGPTTAEEANARIEEAEKEIANGHGYAFDDVIAEARKRAGLYEGSIY